MEVTSKHLRSATELQLLIPIRNGFVENTERLTSYATRLQMLLQALSESGRIAAERDRLLTSGPIDTLQSIYATQWGVVERPEGSLLLVSSSFDRSWEDYFHLLVDRTGPLLDAIFMHCEGFVGHTCADGFESFAAFIRGHQVQNGFFYMAASDLTVDDLRRARKLLREGQDDKQPLGSVQEEAAAVRARRIQEEPELRQRLQASQVTTLTGLYALGRSFPQSEPFDTPARLGEARSAQRIFNEAAQSLLRGQVSSAILPALPAPMRGWATPLVRDPESPEKQAELVAAARAKRLSQVALSAAELDDIQGNILEPYRGGEVLHGCTVLIQCDNAAAGAALLRQLKPQITSAQAEYASNEQRTYLNLGLTYAGLKRLGLSEQDLALLPKEFREGMAARAGLVGDVGFPNYPDFWRLPTVNWPPSNPSVERISLSSVDMVLTLHEAHAAHAGDHRWSLDHPLYPTLKALNLERHGARILFVQPLRKRPRGHFDLAEAPSVGQPVPCVTIADRDLTRDVPERDRIPLGELLLGYNDNRGMVAMAAEQRPELYRNGSFLVMRKLGQDVKAYRELIAKNMEKTAGDAKTVKGWLVGRDDAGAPLTPKLAPGQAPEDFDFQHDPGTGCPYHAHMRLANPRTVETAGVSASDLVPRIMRRSVSYGVAERGCDDDECGLLFMAYNASIARQFEVVQRWLNAGNSTGLASSQNDLLTGAPQPSATRHVFHQGAWQALGGPSQPLVRLEWGLYLFVPSRSALQQLIDLAPVSPCEDPTHVRFKLGHDQDVVQLEALGNSLIERLNGLAPERARIAWKQLIEGDPGPSQLAVWSAIRKGSGQVNARGYGLLIATEEKASLVLSDRGQLFSVREYHRRLGATIGDHYLGFDPEPASCASDGHAPEHPHTRDYERAVEPGDYWQLAAAPNSYFQTLGNVHKLALDLTNKALDASRPGPLPLPALVKTVVAHLANSVVGISDDTSKLLEYLEHFIIISRYSFQPYPDEQLEAAALRAGESLRSAYEEYVGPMQRALGGDPARDRVAALGAIVGFAAPAVASLLTVLGQWLRSGEFWRIGLALRTLPARERHSLVLTEMVEVLTLAPIPPLLYRTAVAPNPLDAQPGELVVVGTSSVAIDARKACRPATDEPWLTGGEHGDLKSPTPPHGCPARKPAYDMMAGVLEAVLSRDNVTQSSTMTITFGL